MPGRLVLGYVRRFFALQPCAGAVFHQSWDIGSDPPGVEGVVFLFDDAFNPVSGRRWESDGQSVANLADRQVLL